MYIRIICQNQRIICQNQEIKTHNYAACPMQNICSGQVVEASQELPLLLFILHTDRTRSLDEHTDLTERERSLTYC